MSAPVSVGRFYDRLSHDYHLLYPDWNEAIAGQAATLARLIETAHGPTKGTVLDCACGIGTQALGLAALGYAVTGTDVSPRAVARARREARSRKLGSARFTIADMLNLPHGFRDAFDTIVGCDNPLAHLLRPEDLRIAFLGMRTALRTGGLLLLSGRDYDRLVLERPREMSFRHRHDGRRTTIVFQIWDWDTSEPTYVNNHFILESRIVGWKTNQTSTKMRAHTRIEITEALEAAGFVKIVWHDPEQSGYFQPIVSAVSPS
jgi:glycine/sarcosine N-methyltransferase